jgi:hypothetical protein
MLGDTCRVAESTVTNLLPHLFAVLFDFLWLAIIESDQFIASVTIHPEQLTEFGVDRLCIPVFGSLDEQCHHQGRQGRDGIPVE